MNEKRNEIWKYLYFFSSFIHPSRPPPYRMEEPLFQEEESAWGEDPDYYNDISKLSVNLPGDRGVPPPPSGQYMPTSPTVSIPQMTLDLCVI